MESLRLPKHAAWFLPVVSSLRSTCLTASCGTRCVLNAHLITAGYTSKSLPSAILRSQWWATLCQSSERVGMLAWAIPQRTNFRAAAFGRLFVNASGIHPQPLLPKTAANLPGRRLVLQLLVLQLDQASSALPASSSAAMYAHGQRRCWAGLGNGGFKAQR